VQFSYPGGCEILYWVMTLLYGHLGMIKGMTFHTKQKETIPTYVCRYLYTYVHTKLPAWRQCNDLKYFN
jgi:hypothetical protein